MMLLRNLTKTPTFWVLILTCVVYANTLPNGFTFDDHAIIENNPVVRSLDIAQIFTAPYWPNRESAGLYRPLTTLSFALHHALHTTTPFGYHLINVVLHTLNALLVFRLARHLIGASPGAWAAALIFALHPVQTEAVNGIVGRAELLSAFWVLCAWLLYIRSGVGKGSRLNRTYGLALLASFLGILSKENAACLLGLLIIYDGIWVHRARWPGGIAGFLKHGLPRYVPFIMLIGAFLFVRTQVVGSVFLPIIPLEFENPLPYLEGASRVFTTLAAWGVYLRLLVFPLWLSPDYSYGEIPTITALTHPLAWGPLVVILILLGLTIFWLTKRWFLSGTVGILTFACAFAPVSNLFIIIGTILGERLLYLPMVGVAILLGAGVTQIASRTENRRYVYLGMALLLSLYSIRTIARNSDWYSDVTLFSAAVKDGNQSAKVYYNLGVGYRKQNQVEDATLAFERVAEYKPNDPDSWRYLGIIYSEQGRITDAIRAYETAVAQDATQIHIWKNLARLYAQAENPSKAISAYQHAIDIHPDDTEVLLELAKLCRRQNRQRCALRHAQALIDQDPKHREGVLLLIALLIETNRYSDARRYLKNAQTHWPTDVQLNALAKRITTP